jgi:signal transduction histidine kinase
MIGRIFNRTLTYGLLVAASAVAYVYGVANVDAWFGLDSDWLAPPQVAAAGIVAVVFHPVRLRLESLADRLVYGRRISPSAAVAQITALGGGAGDGPRALRELARIVAVGLGTGTATVRLDLADGGSVGHTWPAESEHEGDESSGSGSHSDTTAASDGVRRLPIVYQGTVVGAFELPAAAGRGPAPRRRALIERLTQSAGVLLHNASLDIEIGHQLAVTRRRAAEIHASRWRIVAAQDSERRELERDLHDGAQPGLTAVRLGLGLVTHLAKAGRTAPARKALTDLCTQIENASGGLRQTLRGLDPDVLRELGIAAAVRELAEELGLHEHTRIVDATDGLRLRPHVEAAAYFCCVEALQNAAKHSPGAALEVALRQDAAAGMLCFEVRDEGPGFDNTPDDGRTTAGSGLQNMADRAAAVGGSVEITSSADGTVVAGRVPALLP